ncbi:MAG: (2Fe-2S)-binding protein [Sedimentisphaerales bacterium]|nr:(2Fe-2S)-binding protein [Sedimentisphaerales bacterium]
MEVTVTLTVNGIERTITTDSERPLIDVIREDLQLTGTKEGCGEGRCGACSVLMDGQRVLSCVTAIVQADGKSIRTIESLAQGNTLHQVQEAFLAEGAMQCGYCTTGMIMTAVGLLEANPRPTDEEIIAAMRGNICRCNGYTKILNAIRRAVGRPQEVSAI